MIDASCYSWQRSGVDWSPHLHALTVTARPRRYPHVAEALTNLVTADGRFAFRNAFHQGTQAHRIYFSPTNNNIILVGTESSGIIASYDGGQLWFHIDGSEKVTAITSFFFDEVQNNILVSSCGRGLWMLVLAPVLTQGDVNCDGLVDDGDVASEVRRRFERRNDAEPLPQPGQS
jgi:hypothetical protein